MISGLIGKKIGMTQVFSSDGKVVPVTVLQVGPCLVTQIKTKDKDGYASVQLGFVEPLSTKHTRKPLLGHFKKANVPPLRKMREFAVTDENAELQMGQRFKVDLFAEKEKVDVIGTSKGKGFAGVIKRHHFRGGAATHGSMFHRAPGSIGGSSFPSRVFPGMRAAGRMGGDTVTLRNLTVVEIDAENNLMLVEGAVPGATGSYIVVRKAKAGHKAKPVAKKKG
jgi:large subunit ribosomal protein L3